MAFAQQADFARIETVEVPDGPDMFFEYRHECHCETN
jgi:hypothetical protein